jgi:hypothetical protein
MTDFQRSPSLWRVIWPSLAAIVALRIVTFPLPHEWNPSLVPAPGVSVLDAAIFLWAGYHASRRMRRMASGLVAAALTSGVGLSIFFITAIIRSPSLLLVPFEKPFVIAIAGILTIIAVGFGIAAGAVGAAVGRWLPPARRTAGAA